MLPPRKMLKGFEEVGLAKAVQDHPEASLALVGSLVGGLWGGLAGAWLGSWKLGSAVGAGLLGLKGYSHGRDLESWIKEAKKF